MSGPALFTSVESYFSNTLGLTFPDTQFLCVFYWSAGYFSVASTFWFH